MFRRSLFPLRQHSKQLFSSTPFLLAESNRRRKHLGRVHYGDETNPLSKPTILDKGTLYIVPTPIGNVKDFSLRSLEVIRQVDYLFCINKVATQVLLDIIDINSSGRLLQYNKHARSQTKLAELVKGGASAALICPQGTPIVGDQGVDVVQQFLKEGVRVSSLPGPAACISALAMSGSAGSEDAFFFGGHLSIARGTRLRQIKEIVKSRCPVVFYEATPRLRQTLEEIGLLCGKERMVSVVHEISKIHEATHRDRVDRLVVFYTKQDQRSVETKGQVTIVVDADPERERLGHRMFSAVARNERLSDSRKRQPHVDDGERLTVTRNSNNNSASEKTMTGDTKPNLTFREKLLYKLVHEQAMKQSRLSATKQKENDEDDFMNDFDEKFAKSAAVFIAEEMEIAPSKVWNSYAKVKEYLVNESFRQEQNLKHQVMMTASSSNENDDVVDEEENEITEADDDYQELDDLPQLARFKVKQRQQQKEKQGFSLVRNVTESRSEKVEGDEHFPSDWLPEEEETTKEEKKEQQQTDLKNEATSSNDNLEQNATNKDDDRSKDTSLKKRRLLARQKLLKAIAKQEMKTKIARQKLKEEQQRDLFRNLSGAAQKPSE